MASSVGKESEQTHITIKVQDQRSRDHQIYFRLRKDAPLNKLMRAYCDKVGLDNIDMVRFFIDDERVKGFQTPNDLNMADGDVIDAFLEQSGGGGDTTGNNIGFMAQATDLMVVANRNELISKNFRRFIFADLLKLMENSYGVF